MRRVVALSAAALINIAAPQSGEVQSQLNPEHTFTIREENGIRIAESSGGPKYLGEIFRYERVLVLQEDSTRPEALIGKALPASHIGDDGSIFIRDYTPKRFMRFSADGTYLNDIGRMGQGPGEYENPVMQSVSGGVVSIFDSYRGRVTLFEYDGSLIEMITTPQLRRRLSFRAAHPLPDGGFWLVDDQPTPVTTGYEYFKLVVTCFSTDQDTLASLQVGPVKGCYRYKSGDPRGYSGERIFRGYPNVEFHPERGIYTTTGMEPTITVHDFTGRVVQIIDGGIPPEPVSRQERRIVMAGVRKEQDVFHADEERAVVSGRRKHIEFCDPKAFWEDLVVDEYGYLWAELPNDKYYWYYRLITPGFVGYEHRLFRVFSPEGEYVGITKVPTRGTISRGHFIALEYNREREREEVVLYKIIPAIAGFRFPE